MNDLAFFIPSSLTRIENNVNCVVYITTTSMKLVLLKTYDNSIEAHMLKSKLESEGIRCYIFDEYTVTLNPIFSNAVGGIRVMIDAADQDAATKLFIEIQNSKLINQTNEVIHCSKCGSEDFYDYFKSFRGVSGVLSILFSFAFFTYPIFYKTVYKCKKCGEEIEIS